MMKASNDRPRNLSIISFSPICSRLLNISLSEQTTDIDHPVSFSMGAKKTWFLFPSLSMTTALPFSPFIIRWFTTWAIVSFMPRVTSCTVVRMTRLSSGHAMSFPVRLSSRLYDELSVFVRAMTSLSHSNGTSTPMTATVFPCLLWRGRA